MSENGAITAMSGLKVITTRKRMFESLEQAIKWARENYPECSFIVTEQKDEPTIVSIKGQEQQPNQDGGLWYTE